MLGLQFCKNHYATWMLIGLLCLGCSHTVQRRDWSDYRAPGAEQFQRIEIDVREFIEFSDRSNG